MATPRVLLAPEHGRRKTKEGEENHHRSFKFQKKDANELASRFFKPTEAFFFLSLLQDANELARFLHFLPCAHCFPLAGSALFPKALMKRGF
jgi:hypothetical protein